MIFEIKTAVDDTGIRLIIGMLGFFVVGFGAIKIFIRRQLFKDGIRVIGTVVGMDETRDDGKLMYHPIFTYQTINDEKITHRSAIGYSGSMFSIGEEVKIIYDPSEKDNFIVDSLLGNIAGYLITAPGVIVIMVAIFLNH
jgi:hypothetical protein